MQPTVVRVDSPEDFLALVPALAGFQPRNSLLLVAFRGSRTCGVLRFTLPARAAAAQLRSLAVTVVGLLCKVPDADAVAPVVYTDGPLRRRGRLAHAAFIDAVLRRAELSGFAVRDALCHAADGWGCYTDPHCPGHPLESVTASPLHGLTAGRSLDDVAAGARIPDADRGARDEVGRILRVLHENAAGDAPRALMRAVAGLPRLLERLLGEYAAPASADEAALLLFAVQGPPLRDAAMLQCAFGGGLGHRVLAENLRYADGDTDAPIESAQLLMGEGPRPDPARVERAVALLRTLVALAPDSHRVPPLVMLAWLHWALGHGTAAGLLLDRALRLQPGYGMATLLRALFSSGRMPEWAFRPDPPGDGTISDR